jgi:cell division protein FtsI/penicillin-binding protein 2
LDHWLGAFGLGRPTGIGIAEVCGTLPEDPHGPNTQFINWTAGIGQGQVHATPIQMANVAATIARNGIWMRPRLVSDDQVGRPDGESSVSNQNDKVDLHLSPAALAAVQKGMHEVCTEVGGGSAILPQENDTDPATLAADPLVGINIAGKTGSAQTGGFMKLVEHDASGKPFIHQVNFGDPGTDGWYSRPQSAAPDDPHPEYHLAHAWFIGYAPAEHPEVAFCVMIEYGEAGSRVAGPIAHDLLVACIKHGYLHGSK